MPLQIPNVKSLSDAGLSLRKDKFSLPKGLASLRSSSLPEAQEGQPEGKTGVEKEEPSDDTTANAQSSSESSGIKARSQLQLEQWTKKMTISKQSKDEPSDEATVDGQGSPDGTPAGVKSRSQLQLEQWAKKMAMPSRSASLNLWKGLGRNDSTEISEIDGEEDDEETDPSKEWSKFSISEVAQYIPALNYQLPKLPKFSLPSLSLPVRSPSTDDNEDVYIVLRPINFKHSSREILQRVGEVTDMAELQRYLLFQHWGVKVGKYYYHLHIVEEDRKDGSQKIRQKLAVSLSEFDQHTLKVPIWQTGKTHEKRVMNALSVIRAMGGFKKDDEVDIYGDHSGLQEHILPEEERQRYRRTGPAPRRFLFVPFSGEYNAAVNNCINFSANYLFYHIFDLNPFATTATDFKKKMAWLSQKWVTSGCKIDKEKLMDMFTSPLGLLNPMRTLTRTGDGNIFLVRLLLVFLGKIRPEGTAAVEGISPDIRVISEGDVKAAAPQVEKDADAEIETLKA